VTREEIQTIGSVIGKTFLKLECSRSCECILKEDILESSELHFHDCYWVPTIFNYVQSHKSNFGSMKVNEVRA